MKKIKIIALYGPSGVGKDTILKGVIQRAGDLVHPIVSCTTRPQRGNETEGVDYYYLTPHQFYDKIVNNEMLESTEFNGWFYGTSYDSLDPNKVNIGVFNPDGIDILKQDNRIELITFRITAKDKIRLLRQLNREEEPDVEEIIRRYKVDKEDFPTLFDLFPNYIVANNTQHDLDFAIRDIVKTIKGGETNWM